VVPAQHGDGQYGRQHEQVDRVGNLGKDPEVRYTQGGQAVGNFSIACNEKWTDKHGQKQERTEWVRIVVWGKTAESVRRVP
jgi:single-strand DNA-binding protein